MSKKKPKNQATKPQDKEVANSPIVEEPNVVEEENKAIETEKGKGVDKKEEYNWWQRLLIKIGNIKIPEVPVVQEEPEMMEPNVVEETSNSNEEILRKELTDKIHLQDVDNSILSKSLKSVLLFIDPEVGEINEVTAHELEIKANDIIDKLRKKESQDHKTETEDKIEQVEKKSPVPSQDSASVIKKLEEDLQNAKQRADELEAGKKKEIEEKNKLREEKKVLQAEVDSKRISLETLREEIQRQEKLAKESSSKFEEMSYNYENDKKEYETHLQEHQKKNELNEAEIKRLSERLNDLSLTPNKIFLDRLNTAREKIAEQQQEISSHNNKITEKEETISFLHEEIKVRDNKFETLKEEKTNLEKDILEITKSKKELEGQLNQKDLEIQNGKKFIDQQTKEIEKNVSTIEKLRSEVGGLEKLVKEKSDNLELAQVEIEEQKKNIADRDNKIANLDSSLKERENELIEKKSDLEASKKQVTENVEDFRHLVLKETDRLLEDLNEGGYLTGTGEMGESCLDGEDRNKRLFGKLADQIQKVAAENYNSVKDYRKAIIDIVGEDLRKETGGCILPLARLIGYVRMPFMRDNQGSDYMILNKVKLSKIETDLVNLLALLGIGLVIPTPYCDRLNEGQYEAQSGSISNLDFICPNARQHLGKVDRVEDSDIVTDIVMVGYRIPGEALQKAKVIL